MQFRRTRECYFCRKNIDMLTSSANIYMRDVAENHKEYRYVCGRYAVGVAAGLLVWGWGWRGRHDAEAWVDSGGGSWEPPWGLFYRFDLVYFYSFVVLRDAGFVFVLEGEGALVFAGCT